MAWALPACTGKRACALRMCGLAMVLVIGDSADISLAAPNITAGIMSYLPVAAGVCVRGVCARAHARTRVLPISRAPVTFSMTRRQFRCRSV